MRQIEDEVWMVVQPAYAFGMGERIVRKWLAR
jgi:hypothetical protein